MILFDEMTIPYVTVTYTSYVKAMKPKYHSNQ